MKKRMGDTVLAILFFGLGVFIFFQLSIDFRQVHINNRFESPAFFPQIVGGFLLILSIILLLQVWIYKPTSKKENQEAQTQSETRKKNTKKAVYTVFTIIIYTILLRVIGYLFLTLFLIGFLMWILEAKKLVTIVILSILITVVVYFIFYELLDVVLPRGKFINLF